MSGQDSRRGSSRGGRGGWRGGSGSGGGGGWRGGGSSGGGGWRGRGSSSSSGGGGWRGRGNGGGWRGRPWRGGSGGGWRGGAGNHAYRAQRVLCQTTLDALCPYKGWTLYFTDGFIESGPNVEKIKVFEKYFTSRIHLFDKDEIERQGSVLVDYADLIADKTVRQALPDIVTQLKQQPEVMLNCLGLAIHQFLCVTLDIVLYQQFTDTKVQELISGEQRETGRIPRTVECHLTSDLCDSCVPGDTVTVTGIVRVSNDGPGSSRGNKDQCMFLLYIEATSVSNTKGKQSKMGGQGSSGAVEDRCGGEEFSLKELYAIQEIQSQPDLLRLIVHSLCPVIYGHLAVCNVAPRGIYVCGNSTSTTGLTVSLSRDAGTGDYALEAGALVLADQGLCCIDEFDKMGNQQQALLEAMEQQSVSLAKAGIVSSLPARTSVVAAANPVGGHYNRGKTVSENLKMGSALLSRFDVVFLLLDIPDESHDRQLSEHVMANRSGRGRTSISFVLWFLFFSLANTYSDGLGNLDFERSQLGSGMSQRSAAKRLVNALHQHAQRTGQKQFDVQTLRSIANRVNVKVMDFEGLLSSLNEQGFLLKKGPKLYQLQTI
ncbi:DNA helicase MCM8 [Neolamprologus brichardi]|uniref:DNA helicase MCM8 n=1 Tax=Neolamprologus brichardi TaxID=32507 RepID=UPI001643CD8C|nr:DNA helicase MCM8 [Neolamprologus brichardi]